MMWYAYLYVVKDAYNEYMKNHKWANNGVYSDLDMCTKNVAYCSEYVTSQFPHIDFAKQELLMFADSTTVWEDQFLFTTCEFHAYRSNHHSGKTMMLINYSDVTQDKAKAGYVKLRSGN